MNSVVELVDLCTKRLVAFCGRCAVEASTNISVWSLNCVAVAVVAGLIECTVLNLYCVH